MLRLRVPKPRGSPSGTITASAALTTTKKAHPSSSCWEGVFGFTYAPHIDVPVFNHHNYLSFEIHRLPGGAVHLLGFVRPQEAEQLALGAGPLELFLFPGTSGDATRLVSVEHARLSRIKPPARDNSNSLQITVEPA